MSVERELMGGRESEGWLSSLLFATLKYSNHFLPNKRILKHTVPHPCTFTRTQEQCNYYLVLSLLDSSYGGPVWGNGGRCGRALKKSPSKKAMLCNVVFLCVGRMAEKERRSPGVAHQHHHHLLSLTLLALTSLLTQHQVAGK